MHAYQALAASVASQERPEILKPRIARGDAWGSKKRVLDWHLEFDTELNEVKDTAILQIVERMKQ
jgi:hypothetical protein